MFSTSLWRTYSDVDNLKIEEKLCILMFESCQREVNYVVCKQ